MDEECWAFLLHEGEADGKRGAAAAKDAELDELSACSPGFINVFGGDSVVAVGALACPEPGPGAGGVRFGHFPLVVDV